MDGSGDTGTAIPVTAASGRLGLRFIWVMLLRVGLISVLLTATMVLNYQSSDLLQAPSPRFLLVLIAATYVLTIAYGLWYRLGRAIQMLARIQFGLDLVLWGCLAYATGGVLSGFTFLFDLWVILAAVVFGGRAAFYVAGASAAILLALAAVMHAGIVVPLADQIVPESTAGELSYAFGVNVTGLVIVATLVSSLSARLERTGRGLERERERRADLAVLHSDTIRSLTVGLATTGLKGQIVTMNPAGLQMIGPGAGDVEGQPLDRLMPEAGKLLAIPDMEGGRGHGVLLRPDGRRVPVEYTVARLLGADGGRRGAIVVFGDLTIVRKLEADLERSRRLAALGELSVSLAHEIRNPLGAVSGSFQLLTGRKDLGEEDRALLDIISREIGRMERLIADMLDFARPKEADRNPCDVAALVAEVVEAFRLSQEAEDREVIIDAGGSIEILADASRLRQVVWNLLRNAAQVTDAGGEIDVSVRDAGDRVEIEVKDRGPGITPEDRRRIFEPFFSTRERGLGIGLALCKRIVEGHNGRIDAEPREGGGTVVRVTLPRQAARHVP
ncbi:MAG: ATP-binding protein [Deltaproteobacteria bacterium]|nr:ATP-binding protein [Deltaproteobacteria bacterium]